VPELPDVLLYMGALEPRIVGQRLERVRLTSPFVLRTVAPPISVLEGKRVGGLSRLGKQIVLGFDDDLYLVIHLMVAGRFQWRAVGKALGGRNALASFHFSDGVLFLTEASKKKRAALHVVEGASNLARFGRGGLEVLGSTLDEFAAALQRENHTLKRALTDPRLFSGIGNAYSDEILHRAKLSPLQLSSRLAADGIARLHEATKATLTEWITRLREEAGDRFPSKVTAFRPEMAVHGRFGKPCPLCGTSVRRIVYAANECNYCPTCQTGGRLLADRGLSRLLKDLEDWEEHFAGRSSTTGTTRTTGTTGPRNPSDARHLYQPKRSQAKNDG
jgi:formamidopyrimidine-DNA glycosylase